MATWFTSLFSSVTTWATSLVGGIGGWFVGIFLNWAEGKAQTAVTNAEDQSTEDSAIDAHAASTVTEMNNAQTQAALDKADGDILSGN